MKRVPSRKSCGKGSSAERLSLGLEVEQSAAEVVSGAEFGFRSEIGRRFKRLPCLSFRLVAEVYLRFSPPR